MNKPKVVLTGVKPTGMPHLGNYSGAMRPAIQLASEPGAKSLLFIADYHSLTAVHEGEVMRDMIYEVAAAWLACGLDTNKTVFYRQSDVPEIFELSWILSCMAAKGLMNRAHAYKAKIQENQEAGKEDLDFGVNMGLFTYPILMSADILMYSSTHVPVGEDQVQHVEIARDIAQKFNRTFGEVLTVPEAVIQKQRLLTGLDGRKMSKSYGNHIPLFEDANKMRKLVMRIKTDSLPPEAPKDPKTSLIFDIFKEFAKENEIIELEARYLKGIGWGEAKQALFDVLDRELAEPRRRYQDLMSDKEQINKLLSEGRQKAREMAKPLMKKIRQAIGIE